MTALPHAAWDTAAAADRSCPAPDAVAAAVALIAACSDTGGPDRDEIAAWIRAQPDIEVALGRYVRSAAAKPRAFAPGSRVQPFRLPPVPVLPAATRSLDDQIVLPDAPMVDRRDRLGRPQVARIAFWIECIGAIVIVFLAYQLWGTRFVQQHAQSKLRAAGLSAPAAASPAVTSPTRASTKSGKAAPGPAAATSALPAGAIARIQIPAINVDQMVVEGTSVAALERGPGHFTGTPVPGQPGNAAIAGHRTTYGAPFNRLGDLKPGDTILTTTAAGTFLYVVAQSSTVSPTQTSVVDDYGDNRLTLTTCTPEFSASERLVVVSRLEGLAPPTTPKTAVVPPRLSTKVQSVNRAAIRQLEGGGSAWDWGALPGVALIGLLLVALALSFRRIKPVLPRLSLGILLAPMWLGGLLLLFEQLSRFLPPYV